MVELKKTLREQRLGMKCCVENEMKEDQAERNQEVEKKKLMNPAIFSLKKLTKIRSH